MREKDSYASPSDPVRIVYGNELLSACYHGNFDYAIEMIDRVDTEHEILSHYLNTLLPLALLNGGTTALGLVVYYHSSSSSRRKATQFGHYAVELMGKLLSSGACPLVFFMPRGQDTLQYLTEWTGEEALASPSRHIVKLGGALSLLDEKITELCRRVSVTSIHRDIDLADDESERLMIMDHYNRTIVDHWIDISQKSQ